MADMTKVYDNLIIINLYLLQISAAIHRRGGYCGNRGRFSWQPRNFNRYFAENAWLCAKLQVQRFRAYYPTSNVIQPQQTLRRGTSIRS